MTTTLSPRALQLLGAVRKNVELIDEHSKKVSQSEANEIYAQMIAHIRSACPQALLVDQAAEVSRG